ncbi:STAS domain-containing protein [Streptomyces sp. NPDC060194]|uniref:STAS domain-containing protein n=1 Tax=Streptomyces sp. NPDC060194 TaxID=3347069 RepID=UPI0036493D50
MNASPLDVTTSTHPSGAHVVAAAGELDHHTAPELTRALTRTPFDADSHVVLDLSGLEYCDSTGITVLITAYQRAQSTGARLTLAGVRPDLRHVLRVVGLEDVFTFRATVEEAAGTQPS